MKKDYIEKKQGVPPKKKTHIINLSNKSDRKNMLNKTIRKTQKVKTSKEITNDIKLLKSRMDKTKRPKTVKIFNKDSTKGEFLEETFKEEKLSKKQMINNEINKNIKNNSNSSKINLINVNLNDLKKKVYIPQESKHILNIYSFEEALKYEKRLYRKKTRSST